ncbi:MAG TPA: choice-of-anchor tandem repeat GloVer-containing protein [Rhizomicrobium sp.]
MLQISDFANRCALAGSVALAALMPSSAARAGVTENVLYDFCSQAECTDGLNPNTALMMDATGNLYGETSNGDAGCGVFCGVAYKIASDGTETALYNFCSQTKCSDGAAPVGGLILDEAENLYGATRLGGTSTENCAGEGEGCGTIFKLTPGGTHTVLYSFCALANCADGAQPQAGLISDSAGNLYGTTSSGGANDAGTVFEIAPDGTEAVLYSFCSQTNCSDGGVPEGGLIFDGAGNLYGTTSEGGIAGGTVFKLAPDGTETPLYSFSGGSDGGSPSGSIAMDSAGNIYGATQQGGDASCVTPVGGGCGTIFKVTSSGSETTLHIFEGSKAGDGNDPVGGIVADSAGNLYGTTLLGGSNTCSRGIGCGIVFELASSGTETVLFAFGKESEGRFPEAGVTLDPKGNLYGTTEEGGKGRSGGYGTAFKLSFNHIVHCEFHSTCH